MLLHRIPGLAHRPNSSSTWRLAPARGARGQSARRRAERSGPAWAAAGSAAPASSPGSGTDAASLSSTYDLLSSLITPPGDEADGALTAGATPLGRGLIARRAVPAGAPLLTVELWNALCIDDAGGAFGARALDDWQAVHGPLPPLLDAYLRSGSDWFLRLVAWLLYVARHGSGVWPLYRALLPAAHESLMWFLPEERGELQSAELEELAARERSAILRLHDTVFSEATGDLAALKLAAVPEDTLWAASMVNSRCFADEAGGHALSLVVPCADMANHSDAPNAEYRLDADAGCFQLFATRDIAAGEEVCISYLGTNPTKPNSAMLKDHGFVIPGNINDRIFGTAGSSSAPLQALDPNRLGAVLVAAASTASSGAASGSSSGGSGAVNVRRLQAAALSMRPYCRPPSGAQAPDDEQRAAAEALLGQIGAMSSSHATTLQDDEALLSNSGAALSPCVRAAVAARLERKRLLAAGDTLLRGYVDVIPL